MTRAADGPADKVILSGMRFFAYHGVLPDERERGQEFEVDVEMEGDFRAAGEHDDVAQTIDYTQAYGIVKAAVESDPKQLIEAVAESIARNVLALGRVRAVTVRVRKPAVALPGPITYSGVEIRRTRA